LKVVDRPDGTIEIQRDDGVPIAVMCHSAAAAQNAHEIVKRVNQYGDLVALVMAAKTFVALMEKIP
jgi:hypothetical protein